MSSPYDLRSGDSTLHKRPTAAHKGDVSPPSTENRVKESGDHYWKRIVMSATAGAVFGLAIEKGRVFEPEVIVDQMLMRRFIMSKMFLSAVASGMFSMSILSMIPATQHKFLKTCRAYVLPDKSYLAVILGTALLGSGMTLSGACPGMVLAQVGAGTANALYTLGGAFMGAALYATLAPAISRLTRPARVPKEHFLHELADGPYFVLALPISSIIALIVFGLELFAPWQRELNVANAVGTSYFSLRSWPPYVAGVLIGLMQIPIILAVDDTLGGSSSYCTMMSQALPLSFLQKRIPYLAKFKSGIGNWWQVAYIFGAIGGAYFSSQMSDSYGTVNGMLPIKGFLGGALMLFGARLAGGCTSGHGLSGFGLLYLLSFAAVPAMFAGGIGTAFIMKFFNWL